MTVSDRFVRAAVARYSQAPYSVKHWEVYSEPDCVSKLGVTCYAEWGSYPREYASALEVAFRAAKAADPTATVIMGSVAYDWFDVHPRRFLDEVLAAGAGPYFDVFGFNYFTLFAPVWAPYGADILGKVGALSLS